MNLNKIMTAAITKGAISATRKPIAALRGDVALADGEAVIEGLKAPDGGALPPIVHRFTDVLVRDGGGWRIAQIRAYVFMDGPRP